MNPVVVVHFIAAVVAIVVAVPLIQRRVKMNRWYGVRIPAAFTSDEAWFEINHYGGRLLLVWGVVIGATAVAGVFVDQMWWIVYDWSSLVIIFVGLLTVLARIYRFARTEMSSTRNRS